MNTYVLIAVSVSTPYAPCPRLMHLSLAKTVRAFPQTARSRLRSHIAVVESWQGVEMAVDVGAAVRAPAGVARSRDVKRVVCGKNNKTK